METVSDWWKEWQDRESKSLIYKVESTAVDIALQIHDRLRELSLSQRDLAQRLLSSQAYVSQILNGKPNMTLETLTKIALALALDLRVILAHPNHVCPVVDAFPPVRADESGDVGEATGRFAILEFSADRSDRVTRRDAGGEALADMNQSAGGLAS